MYILSRNTGAISICVFIYVVPASHLPITLWTSAQTPSTARTPSPDTLVELGRTAGVLKEWELLTDY